MRQSLAPPLTRRCAPMGTLQVTQGGDPAQGCAQAPEGSGGPAQGHTLPDPVACPDRTSAHSWTAWRTPWARSNLTQAPGVESPPWPLWQGGSLVAFTLSRIGSRGPLQVRKFVSDELR